MTETDRLYLVSLPVDRVKLAGFAAKRGTIPPSGDLGYALHQALNETFGEGAPQPFHYSNGFDGPLVAYSQHGEAKLRELSAWQRKEVAAWALASEALGFASMRVWALPENWPAGTHYRFSVRTRPVCRVAHNLERNLPRECDVFMRAVATKGDGARWLDKHDVYDAWFREQIPEAAATLKSVRISRLGKTQVYRKGAPNLAGPDVTFSGVLQAGDPALFQDCLRRGVGRHRAFGFGMILLGNICHV
jgi:CRISPR system Cascade subunit CasE